MGRWWRELLESMPYSRAELFLRSLKDIRADTCDAGMLAHSIEQKKTASLYFYVALLSGFRKMIFPGMTVAYEGFITSGDWRLIEKARVSGFRAAGIYVKQLKSMYEKGRATAGEIEKHIKRWVS